MTSQLSIEDILAESEHEVGRFDWEGTFSEYLGMVINQPSLARLSHSLIHDAITVQGVDLSDNGEPTYKIFEGEIFGLEKHLEAVVQYFAAAAQRMEVRKRILLLLGPPASGKSSVVDLVKRALERYTQTDDGAVYTIQGCPMQEEPLHLIPDALRLKFQEDYGIHIEGELCPRCKYMLKNDYNGQVSEIPVERVTFNEKEAVGIGYYLATNPNPTDASLLVGSVNDDLMDGERDEVAAKAFRLDGELNIANRGIMEFVEMFKADRHMLNTLLDLAQGQVIKNQRFGSVYADEVIIGHSNEGDFDSFATDVSSEALRDRIIALQVPYNLRVSEEVKIYRKMMTSGQLEHVHMAPLTMRVASAFATLSRLEPPSKQGMSFTDKLHLYDGQMVSPYTKQDVMELQRHHPNEGMSGISPRYVMNRISAAASRPGLSCISPLAALDSLWQGLSENVSLDQGDLTKHINYVEHAVKEYSELALKDVQKAFEEAFEDSADMLLDGYLTNVELFLTPGGTDRGSETDMRGIERSVGITDRSKQQFRREIQQVVTSWRRRGRTFEYTSEPRLQSAIETHLFKPKRVVERGLTQPRFAKQRVEWAQRRTGIANRLQSSYGYCGVCSGDVIDYVTYVLKKKQVVKTPKNESVEWLWPLNSLETADAEG